VKGLLQHIVFGVFVAIGMAIIFVKAGQKSGVSGGQQASQIIGASGQAFTSGVTALEGGA
jgi:hypothetical protein